MRINTEPEQGFTKNAPNVIGTSPAIKEVYQQINKQKKYRIYLLAKTPQNVLLSNYPIEKKKIKNSINDKED